jgi:hypothetical protein
VNEISFCPFGTLQQSISSSAALAQYHNSSSTQHLPHGDNVIIQTSLFIHEREIAVFIKLGKEIGDAVFDWGTLERGVGPGIRVGY